jgi:hypothetical protein
VGAGVLHDFGGLSVRSAFALPGLATLRSDGRPDQPAGVQISLGHPAPPPGRPVHQWRGRYGLALDACGDDWLIRHDAGIGVTVADSARLLQCHCPDATRLPLLAEILVRRVLPRVSALHGRLPIHAATVGDGDGAVMLIGTSGAGKSTLTAALARRLGWRIFSDDMSILCDESRPLVFPAAAGVSVWPASQQALDLPLDQCRPLQAPAGKVWYAPPPAAPSRPTPLDAMILLSSGEGSTDVEFRRLDGPIVAVMVLSQLVPFNPRDVDEMAGLAARWTRLIAGMPAYGLAYPRRFDALPDVVDAVRRLRADAAGASD